MDKKGKEFLKSLEDEKLLEAIGFKLINELLGYIEDENIREAKKMFTPHFFNRGIWAWSKALRKKHKKTIDFLGKSNKGKDIKQKMDVYLNEMIKLLDPYVKGEIINSLHEPNRDFNKIKAKVERVKTILQALILLDKQFKKEFK